jgi:mevalonate kinase
LHYLYHLRERTGKLNNLAGRSKNTKSATSQKFYAKGKLLITGEYLIMDGAHGLAVPSLYGQSLEVKKGRGSEIKWSSLDRNDEEWFKAEISLFDFKCEKSTDESVGDRLGEILIEAVRLNSDFLSKWNGLKVTSKCEFPLTWGLGSSSTLVYCIAQWADVDPFDLYERTFGGSGYDIACADAKGPIYFHRDKGDIIVEPASFDPQYKDGLYFIHTGRKKNTREGIAEYKKNKSKVSSRDIDSVSEITHALAKTRQISDANKLITEHEKLISNILAVPPVKETNFTDFWGSVKSLGAWGGDFVMATSDRSEGETRKYFNEKGFETILKWDEMVFANNEEAIVAAD